MAQESKSPKRPKRKVARDAAYELFGLHVKVKFLGELCTVSRKQLAPRTWSF